MPLVLKARRADQAVEGTRAMSTDKASDQNDHNCSDRRGGNPAGGLVANPEINAKALQKKAADERSRKPRDHILEKTGAADQPTCQPACHNADPGLDRQGSFVQRGKGLPIHADADWQPSAGWLRGIGFAPASRVTWVALGCFRHVLDMDGRGETIQDQLRALNPERLACLDVLTVGASQVPGLALLGSAMSAFSPHVRQRLSSRLA